MAKAREELAGLLVEYLKFCEDHTVEKEQRCGCGVLETIEVNKPLEPTIKGLLHWLKHES